MNIVPIELLPQMPESFGTLKRLARIFNMLMHVREGLPEDAEGEFLRAEILESGLRQIKAICDEIMKRSAGQVVMDDHVQALLTGAAFLDEVPEMFFDLPGLGEEHKMRKQAFASALASRDAR